MMLDDLYRDVILDHYRSPRNAADLSHVGEASVHENPSCGDALKLEVVVSPEGRVTRIRHESKGCAISVASVSLMSAELEGKTVEEAREIATGFIRMMRGEGEKDEAGLERWGDLAALQGVSRFPVRVKCATLAWHALLGSLEPKRAPDAPAGANGAAGPVGPGGRDASGGPGTPGASGGSRGS